MRSQIYPITTTKVDWQVFDQTCQEFINISPLRQADTEHLNIDDPGTFIGTLDINVGVLETLRHKHDLCRHCSFGFLIETEEIFYYKLLSYTDLNISLLHRAKDGVIAIMTADMRTWRNETLNWCVPYTHEEIRYIFNSCISFFFQCRLKELWKDYKQCYLADKTFVFVSR